MDGWMDGWMNEWISRWDRRTLPFEQRHRCTCSLPSSCLRNALCACKLLAYRTRLSRRHSAIYSTLINTALDLLGVGSAVIACLW